MKRQDGYILVFVLVVMLAVEAFALAISTSAIRAYNREAKVVSEGVASEQLAVMQQKYVFLGKLQQVEGALLNPAAGFGAELSLSESSDTGLSDAVSGWLKKNEFDADEASVDLSVKGSTLEGNNVTDLLELLDETNDFSCEAYVSGIAYKSGDFRLEADVVIQMSGKVDESSGIKTIVFTVKSIDCDSLSITEREAAE